MSLPVPFSAADTLSRLYLAVPASTVAATRAASLRFYDRRQRDAGDDVPAGHTRCGACDGGGTDRECVRCHGRGYRRAGAR